MNSYSCFISGRPQILQPRPVLRGSVTAFSQFPHENNWVDQLMGVEGSGRKGACNPPVLTYQCSNNKLCRHYAVSAGNIESVERQVGGGTNA